MDEYQATATRRGLRELKEHAVAILMLGISLVALYLHELSLAIIPLLWMAFRAGKEQGREEARRDIEKARTLAQLIQFPDDAGANRLTRFPRG